jgi:hypothetical protein
MSRGLWRTGRKLVLGLALTAGAGCQTWVPEVGMTLPSPDYLNHLPTYIPPSPDYPLNRELASLEAAAAAQQQARPVPVFPGGPAPAFP